MTGPLYVALGACLAAAAYTTGLALGHVLFRRYVLKPL